jgi:ABC-type uncharacterized transport system ATPase subunit
VTTGPIDELLTRFARPVWMVEPDAARGGTPEAVVAALRDVPGLGAVEISHGTVRTAVTDDDGVSHQLLAALAAAQVPVLSVERQRPTLEDVFLQLVGRQAHNAAPDGEAAA